MLKEAEIYATAVLTVVLQDGIPRISLNRAGNPPKFDFIGAIRDEKTDQSNVRLADVDGDGRSDVSGSLFV
jgi:hypothetical protein